MFQKKYKGERKLIMKQSKKFGIVFLILLMLVGCGQTKTVPLKAITVDHENLGITLPELEQHVVQNLKESMKSSKESFQIYGENIYTLNLKHDVNIMARLVDEYVTEVYFTVDYDIRETEDATEIGRFIGESLSELSNDLMPSVNLKEVINTSSDRYHDFKLEDVYYRSDLIDDSTIFYGDAVSDHIQFYNVFSKKYATTAMTQLGFRYTEFSDDLEYTAHQKELNDEAKKVEEEKIKKAQEEADKKEQEKKEKAAQDKKSEKPALSMSQINANRKAREYLNYSAFSRAGLIEQLEFEGFSEDDSTRAADSTNTNWNLQAAQKAQDYLNYTSFSRDGLIEQLEFEGFSSEEALYGVEKVGY